jgi:hypothetical protein
MPLETVDTVPGAAVTVAVGGLALGSFVAVLLHVAGAAVDLKLVMALAFGGAVIVSSGLVVVGRALGERFEPVLGLAIVIGTLATSLVLLCGCLVTGLRAGVIFLWWGLLVTAVPCLEHRRLRQVRVDWRETGSVLLIIVVVAVWCRHAASVFPNLRASGIAAIWSDYFIHGTEIARFGSASATGLRSFVLAGRVTSVYHFASYMLPAAVSILVDLPGVALAAAVMLPCGLLVASLGAYVLARTLASPAVGMLAAIGLLVIPDASTHGLQNGYFHFHWMLGTSPGNGYALGVAFVALALAALWRTAASRACLWLSVGFALALIQVRAQVFLVVLPALTITLFCETWLSGRRARLVVATSLLSVVAAMMLLALIPPAWDAWNRYSAMGSFLEAVHTTQAPSAYDGLYRSIELSRGVQAARLFGVLALIPAVLGALTILWPAAMFITVRRTGWRALDTFPCWALVTWLALVLFAPPAPFGARAYQYKGFVVVYASALIWTMVLIYRGVGAALPRNLAQTLSAAALAASVVAYRSEQPVPPRLAWGWQFFGTAVDRGLIDAAAFVRARAVPGDTFALIPVQEDATLDDAATRLAGLADVPAYLTRPAIHRVRPYLREVVDERVARLRALQITSDRDAAFRVLRGMGVRFLVVLGPPFAAFDPAGAKANLQSGGASVFEVPRQGG